MLCLATCSAMILSQATIRSVVAVETVSLTIAADSENREGNIIMRPSIKRSLTGILVAGVLA